MRMECKYYESRTYGNGETVRKCHLDLAPEAPWRCPEHCSKFTPRLADVAWAHGTMVAPPTPPEPASVTADDGSVAALLDEAEEVLNNAGPSIMAEVAAERRRPQARWKRLFKRR